MKEGLISYGLSEKEANIYITALKTGATTSNRLSELTGIRRSTVYEIIETLKKKALITSFIKNKKYFFQAEPPESLIQRLKEKQNKIKRILPSLKKLEKSLPEKPSVQLYEEKIGIKEAMEDMLKSKQILAYGATNMGDKIFGFYTEHFARKRVQKEIMLKIISEPEISKHMLYGKIKKYTKTRTLKSLKNHNSAYFIYDNKLIIITLGQELIAIKIKSPLLVRSQKQIFNQLWKAAKIK